MFELTERALKLVLDEFVKYLKNAIEARRYPYGRKVVRDDGDKIASGTLYDSIQGEVEMDADGNPVAVLYYADYFKYVNKGRKKETKKVPIPSLLEWIQIRGLRPRDRRGRFIENNLRNKTSLAFAIQTNIYKYGIRKTNIYDIGIENLEDMFSNFPNNLPENLRDEGSELFRSIAEDINNYFDKQIKIELPSDIR
jgi:hypothetical protein